ncbi:hypothetical protein CALVIDRAFT_563000 [Calocera viscosa TUFC12733]|uniref:Uncharacterized protein n=1 Tax=Calocera viscosa (strain TUFC12733) TaxID=1330018 RepID=A0A167NFT9_CALVF|nr:hypothetical protein CALVIDRAFT_563000 [Calocera viscosa TUFC12733]
MSIDGNWKFAVSVDGTFSAVHDGKPTEDSKPPITTHLLDRGISDIVTLIGTPQVLRVQPDLIYVLLSVQAYSFADDKADTQATWLLKVSPRKLEDRVAIPDSFDPIALSESWACFSRTAGLRHLHIRSLINQASVTALPMDVWHGSIVATYASVTKSLYLCGDEWAGVRILSINTAASDQEAPKCTVERDIILREIPHAAKIFHLTTVGMIMAVRESSSLTLYVDQPGHGTPRTTPLLIVEIRTDEYMTDFTITPDGGMLFMLIHPVELHRPSVLRLVHIPTTTWDVETTTVAAASTWPVVAGSLSCDILRHVDVIQMESYQSGTVCQLLLGQANSLLWFNITCSPYTNSRGESPTIHFELPLENAYGDIPQGLPISQVRTRPSMGNPLGDGSNLWPIPRDLPMLVPTDLPAHWISDENLDIFASSYTGRPWGAACVVRLGFGVSSELILRGAHADGFTTTLLWSTPTPAGYRWITLFVDEEVEKGSPDRYIFRYTDCEDAMVALGLLFENVPSTKIKALHPDRLQQADAVQRDFDTANSNTSEPSARKKAYARLGLLPGLQVRGTFHNGV